MIDYGGGSSFAVKMDGPFGNAGQGVKLTSFTAPAENWKGAVSPYFQEVSVEGISRSCKVDLQLPPEQLHSLLDRVLAFVAANEEGTVTLWAIGDRPGEDLTFQATLTEVSEC